MQARKSQQPNELRRVFGFSKTVSLRIEALSFCADYGLLKAAELFGTICDEQKRQSH